MAVFYGRLSSLILAIIFALISRFRTNTIIRAIYQHDIRLTSVCSLIYNIPAEYDPVMVSRALSISDDKICFQLLADYTSSSGTRDITATQAFRSKRFTISSMHDTLTYYLNHIQVSPYTPLNAELTLSIPDWAEIETIDYLFHIVRNRSDFAFRSRFWSSYANPKVDSYNLLKHFLKTCAFADMIREECSKPFYPNSTEINFKCESNKWIEEEISSIPDDIDSLKSRAKEVLWASALHENIKSVRSAALMVPIEFKPLVTEMCAAGDDELCLGLLVSFLNEIGCNPLPPDYWSITDAVLDTFFRYPNWKTFLSMRDAILDAEVMSEINSQLVFFNLHPFPLYAPLPFTSRFTYLRREMSYSRPLLSLFRVINNWDNYIVRKALWQGYFNIESFDDFPYLVTYACLDLAMMRLLTPALKAVCSSLDGSSARLVWFRNACAYPPLSTEGMFDLFTAQEQTVLMKLILTWPRQSVVTNFFKRTVAVIKSEFNYVVKDRPGLVICECAICFTRPTGWSTAAVTPCNHQFCLSCLSTWLSKQSSCPMCRSILPSLKT